MRLGGAEGDRTPDLMTCSSTQGVHGVSPKALASASAKVASCCVNNEMQTIHHQPVLTKWPRKVSPLGIRPLRKD